MNDGADSAPECESEASSQAPAPPAGPSVDLQVSPPPSSFGGFKPKLNRLGFFSPEPFASAPKCVGRPITAAIGLDLDENSSLCLCAHHDRQYNRGLFRHARGRRTAAPGLPHGSHKTCRGEHKPSRVELRARTNSQEKS
ncbi:hypothetical protein CBM2623_A60197 [Cupriavidus taiwanensis]|nr:hypothetical protein CBM2608_A50234 [Cupriavidus taiwanensis]SPA29988.1 hypothetical protein CBM2623_A60197 [Cupriavidus taiwanensis]